MRSRMMIGAMRTALSAPTLPGRVRIRSMCLSGSIRRQRRSAGKRRRFAQAVTAWLSLIRAEAWPASTKSCAVSSPLSHDRMSIRERTNLRCAGLQRQLGLRASTSITLAPQSQAMLPRGTRCTCGNNRALERFMSRCASSCR